jgi:uncharacterized membrane protein
VNKPSHKRSQPEGAAEGNASAGIAAIIDNERVLRDKCSIWEKAAETITKCAGSIQSVWIHAVWFSAWIAANRLLPENSRWDPYPFTFLTLVVSLEAIFLSIFILITANRDAVVAERRMHLDLQINLLSEHENTRMLILLELIAEKLGVEPHKDAKMKALTHEINPTELLQTIDQYMKDCSAARPKFHGKPPVRRPVRSMRQGLE